jgi:type IX secretion system PorP/SprF family membrane protein
MKKHLIIGVIVGFLGTAVQAQQDAMFTHYMYNTQAVNPGYAGSRDALTVTALHRSQWVGFPGAPLTQTITAHMPIANDHFGVGLSLGNDKIGPTNTTGFMADFAYRMKVGEKSHLALGLKGGLNMFQADLTRLKLDQPGDNAFGTNIQSKLLPNVGFGAYYHRERFYAGVSAPKLLENNFYTNLTTSSLAIEKRHYFGILGAVFPIGQSVELKPTTFVKVTPGAPIEADLTANFIFNNKFILGVMGRTGDAAGLLLGLNVTEQLTAGYSFDYSFTNATGRYNYGSHEFMLRYDFIYNNLKKIKSPRYF